MSSVLSICLYAFMCAVVISGCDSGEKKGEKQTEENIQMEVKGEAYHYSSDTINMHGYLAYDQSRKDKLPIVLIVHEWWGLNNYVQDRAKQLAEMGYLALAVDMYGEGMQAENPETAGKLATPFYKDPVMARTRFEAALDKIKTHPSADTSRIAAIGYCFGGSQVLNMAKLGLKLNGVVSFHGNLAGVSPQKGLTVAKVLVCHGEADQFISAEEINTFKKQMDSVNEHYIFKSYPGATHAFTNPEATEKGKRFNIPIAYNAAADTASWNDMKAFFAEIFK